MFLKFAQFVLHCISLPRQPYSRIFIHQICECPSLMPSSVRHLVNRNLVRWIGQLGASKAKGFHEEALASRQPHLGGGDGKRDMGRLVTAEAPPSISVEEASQVMPQHLITQMSGPLDSGGLTRVYSILRKSVAKLWRVDRYQRMLQNRAKTHRKRCGVALLVGILIRPMVTAETLLESVKMRFVLGSKANTEFTLIRHTSVGSYETKPVSLRLCVDAIKEVMVAGIPSQMLSGSARKASLPEGFLHTLGRYSELFREAYYSFTRLIPAAYFFDINGAPIMATTASGWSEGDATLLQPASNDWARCPVIPSQSTYRGAASVGDTYLLDSVFREFPHFLSIPERKHVANQSYYEREKRS